MSVIGYYDMSDGQGDAAQVDEIVNNGHTAVNVTTPNASQLSGLDTLYVQNPSNGGFGAEYQANLGDITAAVQNGMNLIIFDRAVSNADTILPGGGSITAVRDFSDGRNVDIAAGAPAAFTNGVSGNLTDATLDGGNYSNHGYVELSSLPPGATPLLTTNDPSHVVAFVYPYGSGNVFYSTMPLDYYTGTNHSAITQSEIDVFFGNLNDILCFASGSLIETESGPRPVESLRPGDRVITADGSAKPLVWAYRSTQSPQALRRNPRLRPVRILAGALGAGLPHRDLLVSRQHRILVRSRIVERMFGTREVLVAAIRLTALPGIFVDESVKQVDYVHLLFERHEIVFAEGVEAESLLAGPHALEALPGPARDELISLFPEFARTGAQDASARPIPPRMKQKKLLERHSKNARPLVSV